MCEVIADNLFEEVLLNPAKECNKLLVATGYASATMAYRHIDILKERKLTTSVEICIGMGVSDGIDIGQHKAFIAMSSEPRNNFICNYLVDLPPMHSKLYIWLKNDIPKIAFIGSANYTQNAFSNNQREIMSICNPRSSFLYFEMLRPHIKSCTLENISDFILLSEKQPSINILKDVNGISSGLSKLEHVKISHLTSQGTLPSDSSRLNWGYRKNGTKRDHNQAYLQLPPEVYKSDFFPKKPTHFTVLTDDNKTLICVRAQKDSDGQCIHTSLNNSELGLYFRNRLGLANGARVTKSDLMKYGRTDIDFYKIDEETFFMDFSV